MIQLQAAKIIGTGLATTGLIRGGLGIGVLTNGNISIKNRGFSSTQCLNLLNNPNNENNTEEDRQVIEERRETLEENVAAATRLVEVRDIQEENALDDYKLNAEQRIERDRIQNNWIKDSDVILKDISRLSPNDPECIEKSQDAYGVLLQVANRFSNQVDRLTGEATPWSEIDSESDTRSNSDSRQDTRSNTMDESGVERRGGNTSEFSETENTQSGERTEYSRETDRGDTSGLASRRSMLNSITDDSSPNSSSNGFGLISINIYKFLFGSKTKSNDSVIDFVLEKQECEYYDFTDDLE